MPADAPSSPKDVADMLEALARRIRNDPSFGKAGAPRAEAKAGISVSAPQRIDPPGVDDEPGLGAVDVFSDGEHVTVTIETHNVDPSSVHVSLAGGRLLIGVGEGPQALRRDLPLPAPVDEEAAFATLRNGVLDVVLPVRQGAR
jgi:HSP20 family molecular chaperone IbpA